MDEIKSSENVNHLPETAFHFRLEASYRSIQEAGEEMLGAVKMPLVPDLIPGVKKVKWKQKTKPTPQSCG